MGSIRVIFFQLGSALVIHHDMTVPESHACYRIVASGLPPAHIRAVRCVFVDPDGFGYGRVTYPCVPGPERYAVGPVVPGAQAVPFIHVRAACLIIEYIVSYLVCIVDTIVIHTKSGRPYIGTVTCNLTISCTGFCEPVHIPAVA